jgi:hypothetical protein
MGIFGIRAGHGFHAVCRLYFRSLDQQERQPTTIAKGRTPTGFSPTYDYSRLPAAARLAAGAAFSNLAPPVGAYILLSDDECILDSDAE